MRKPTPNQKPFYKTWWFWSIIAVLGIIGLVAPRQEEVDTSVSANPEPAVSAEELQSAVNQCIVLEVYKNYEFTEEYTQEHIFDDSKSTCTKLLAEKYPSDQLAFVSDMKSSWLQHSSHIILDQPLTYYLDLLEQESNPQDNQSIDDQVMTAAVALRTLEEAKQKALIEQRQQAEEKARQAAEAEARAKAAAAKSATSSSTSSSPSSNSSSSSNNSGITGYCKDGTKAYGDPSAKGKANSCYGHGGWVR